jgi:putative ABC transport system permease protein
MKYFPLVWAAVTRKPAESMLICLAIGAAFALFGLMLGLHTTYRHIVERSRQDRLYVNPRFAIATGLRLPMAMRDQIARLDGVSGVGALYLLRGYYQDPKNVGRIRAVDEGMRVAWPGFPVSKHHWDLLFSTPNGLLVSRAAAEKWNLKEGDVFPFATSPAMRSDGAPFWEFQVLAIVPDDSAQGGDGFILGNFGYVDRSRPLQDRGTAMELEVAIADAARANEISVTIDRLFANSGTPTTTIPERSGTENAINSGIATASVTLPVAGAGVFMILLVTANGIARSVHERIPEFAVLKTLGFRDRTLSALVFVEAAIPCLLGAILGTALAAALTQWPVDSLPQALMSVPKPTLSPLVLAWALGCALFLALVSSVIPVLRLRRISVTDALAGR